MAFDRAIASITIFCEASGASPTERRCVAWTLANRVALNNPARYGSTVAAVCVKRYQYSEWNADVADNADLERGASALDTDPIMLDCGAAFDETHAAGVVDPTGGATHYYDHSITAPYWAKQATVTLTTNKFTFLKDVP